MRFVEYRGKPWAAILGEAPDVAVDFVSRLVRYEGSWRMPAAEVK